MISDNLDLTLTTMTEDEIDESNQLLVVIVDVNPNQLMYARHPGTRGFQ